MKKIKRIVLLVVAVLVLLVAASGVKTVLDMKNSADNEVQEEDSTRWAELTSDPLNIEGHSPRIYQTFPNFFCLMHLQVRIRNQIQRIDSIGTELRIPTSICIQMIIN